MESFNTKNYEKIRKIIVDKNANLVGNVLNDKERIVDNYLEKLKIRLYPALEYIKRGVAVSLCSDDPIFFEHTALVDDFLAIIISFDLQLADVKQLCINSIIYSCLNSKQRTQLLKTFNYKWNKFINVYTSKGE